MNRRIVCFALLLVALASHAGAAEPADRHAAIYPYLNDDVVAVAFVDLHTVNVQAISDLAVKSGWIDAEEAEAMSTNVAQIEQVKTELTDLGLGTVYATFRMNDVQYGSPLLVAPLPMSCDPKKLQGQLREMLGLSAKFDATYDSARHAMLHGADKQSAQAMLSTTDAAPRKVVLDALAALGDSDAGVAIFGDADSRRVVREMFPALPPPFAEIDGKLIADGVAWAGVTLDLPPKLGAAVTIQTNSSEAAAKVDKAISQAFQLAQGMLAQQAKHLSPDQQAGMDNLAAALAKIKPTTDANRVTLSLGDNPQEVATLIDLMAQPIKAARHAAYRSQRMNNFKQIALGMLNYESANGSYPPQAIYSEDGKPLLSWRVAILPYLEQQALYDQFHLDEPWDSEHNIKLAETVVPTYQDPDPSILRKLKEPWYTTYLGVAGKGTIFDGREGKKTKDVTDGTSGTVMIVEVTPDRAVPWTKPADWEVDMKKPFEGVDRDGFVTGFCDGSARYISPTAELDKKNWPKELTIAGEEIIDR